MAVMVHMVIMEMKKNKWIILPLVLVLIVAAFFLFGDKKEEEKVEEEPEPVEIEEVVVEEEEPEGINEGSENFVIFGVDTRSNNLNKGTRSDSIMIVHVDHETKEVYVTSILRDCYLQMEGHGYEKITHAHSYGGPEFAMQTLNTNLDLNLDKYITVNFINVADLVDDIGGVEQEITSDEISALNSSISEINSIRGSQSAKITEPGTYLLDGTQAVAYSRIRYAEGGDYKRSDRQRTILFKIFEKAKTLDTMTAVALVEDMLDEVNTNYSSSEVTELLYYLSDYKIAEMNVFPQVFYAGKINGAFVEAPDTLVDMCIGIHSFLYGEEEYTPSQTVQEISDQITANRNAYGTGMSALTLNEDTY